MPREDATARFYRLVWPLMPVVLRTARFMLTGAQAAEAEDLAQETMMKAYKFIDKFAEGTDVKGWVMRILRNTRIDRLRAAGGKAMQELNLDTVAEVLPARPEAADVAIETLTAQDIMENFSDQTLIDALGQLPEDIRFTLLLVDVEQLDQAQAAEILGIPVGTVKSRAHRGRAMLRAQLAKRPNEVCDERI